MFMHDILPIKMQREQRIERNLERMQMLGIEKLPAPAAAMPKAVPVMRKKRVLVAAVPQRWYSLWSRASDGHIAQTDVQAEARPMTGHADVECGSCPVLQARAHLAGCNRHCWYKVICDAR